MRRHQESKLKNSQKSVFYAFDPQARKDNETKGNSEIYTKLYPYMLFEDINNGIRFGYRKIGDKEDQFSLDPPDRQLEQLIAQGLDREHRAFRLNEQVWEFIGECAGRLAAFEEDFYEIVYFSDPTKNKVVEFGLLHIRPLTVTPSKDKFIQHIPQTIAEARKIGRSVELDSNTILRFSLPTQYRGQLRNMIELLGGLREEGLAELYSQELAGKIPPGSLNVTENIRRRKLAIAEATKTIGWSGRGVFNDEALEYYQLYRELQFEKFKASVRDEILKTLNDGLQRIGQMMEFNVQIVMKNVLAANDLEDSLSHLAVGDQPFAEISKRLRI